MIKTVSWNDCFAMCKVMVTMMVPVSISDCSDYNFRPADPFAPQLSLVVHHHSHVLWQDWIAVFKVMVAVMVQTPLNVCRSFIFWTIDIFATKLGAWVYCKPDQVQAKWTCMVPVPCSIQVLSGDVWLHWITNLLLVLGKQHKGDQWSVICVACCRITLVLAVTQFMLLLFCFKFLDGISITNKTKESDNNCKNIFFFKCFTFIFLFF